VINITERIKALFNGDKESRINKKWVNKYIKRLDKRTVNTFRSLSNTIGQYEDPQTREFTIIVDNWIPVENIDQRASMLLKKYKEIYPDLDLGAIDVNWIWEDLDLLSEKLERVLNNIKTVREITYYVKEDRFGNFGVLAGVKPRKYDNLFYR